MWCTPEEKKHEIQGPKITARGEGKTVRDMDGDLLVGILTKPGAPPLAMIVDKRAVDTVGTLKPRRVNVTFAELESPSTASMAVATSWQDIQARETPPIAAPAPFMVGLS